MRKWLLLVLNMATALSLLTFSTGAWSQIGSLSTDLVYYPVTPCRIMDTRVAGSLSGRLQAGTSRNFRAWNSNYADQGGVNTDCNMLRSPDNAAVVLNLTTVSPDSDGYITAFPWNETRPTTSTLNYKAGSVIGNNATLKISQAALGYSFQVYTTSNVDLVADVVGYYAKPVATAIECTHIYSAAVDLLAGTSQYFYTPQCSAGYTIMSGGCYRVPGNTTGNANVYGFAVTSSAHATNPLTQYCGMNNSHATETSSVQGKALCCRIPGR